MSSSASSDPVEAPTAPTALSTDAALPTTTEALLAAYPLPAGWTLSEVHVDEVSIGARPAARAGLAARREDGAEVTGSAAQLESSPLARAYFELLERLAVVEADEPVQSDALRRDARSNGVALHSSWERACRGARLELLERHRVLESWAGVGAPRAIDPPARLQALSTHQWRCARLGPAAAGGAVVVVIGLPRSPSEVPLARGFAADGSERAAASRAADEAIQGLAFLVDEPIVTEAPAPDASPIFHLDHYLHPAHHPLLAGWLDGARQVAELPAVDLHDVRYVDLTPEGFGSLRVARALCESARPLVFGEPRTAAQTPADPSRFHPIA